MAKKPIKITEEQTKRIRALAREGKSILEIHTLTKIPTHIVRYHFERVKLSQLEEIRNKNSTSVQLVASDLNEDVDYQKIIEDLRAKNKKLVEFIAYH